MSAKILADISAIFLILHYAMESLSTIHYLTLLRCTVNL